MAAPIVDLSTIDVDRHVVADEVLRRCLPQAHEFQLLDGIVHLDREQRVAVGYKDWDANPWWARGHVPGRPLMPGVLMLEGCAQISTFVIKQEKEWATDQLIGLAGMDEVRVRGQIVPPARVYFMAKILQVSGRRMARTYAQVLSDGQMKLEMTVIGVML